LPSQCIGSVSPFSSLIQPISFPNFSFFFTESYRPYSIPFHPFANRFNRLN
jgi:hypothetical protein